MAFHKYGLRFILACAILAWPLTGQNAATKAKIPIIHTSDLYDPTYDPDDNVDLICLYALEELDVRAVILDYGRQYGDMQQYQPGFLPIVQLNWLTGRAVPFAVGPNRKMRSAQDTCEDMPPRDQAGVKLLLEQLESVTTPAYITITGSSRIVAVAFNRRPELFRKKVRAIIQIAGRTIREKGDRLDANSSFDTQAFIAVMRSGLPIRWYPPGTWEQRRGEQLERANDQETIKKGLAHTAKFYVPHTKLFANLPDRIHNWMMYGFTGNQRGDILRFLYEKHKSGPWWGGIMGTTRALSSIPGIVMAADRRLIKTKEGWRFLPSDQVPSGAEEFRLGLLPVSLRVEDDAHTIWQPVEKSNVQMFDHVPDQDLYNQAMGEAVNALLRGLPVE
jgi:hypothetical protein